jgi:hypothetical protein
MAEKAVERINGRQELKDRLSFSLRLFIGNPETR